MISKQRGIVDPWTLGFLLGLTGLSIAQPWDNENDKISKSGFEEVEKVIVINNQTTYLKKEKL